MAKELLKKSLFMTRRKEICALGTHQVPTALWTLIHSVSQAFSHLLIYWRKQNFREFRIYLKTWHRRGAKVESHERGQAGP